jgi:septal ring factor EnvC (AmiA/AmiB activator)
MSEENKAPEASQEPGLLSKEDTAFFIKTVYESLIAPTWSRDDIIELGKVIYAKAKLADIDDKKFAKLFPYLQQIAMAVAERVRGKVVEWSQPLMTACEEARKQITKLEGEKAKLAAELAGQKATIESAKKLAGEADRLEAEVARLTKENQQLRETGKAAPTAETTVEPVTAKPAEPTEPATPERADG